MITSLKPGEIFVFGSNSAGRHGAGAAKQAMKWGARYGQGVGLQGLTYAIPTMNSSITQHLSLDKIKKYVDDFAAFATVNLHLTFLVTEVGCGLAGHSIKDIAPMFAQCCNMPNVVLPNKFMHTYIC